MTARIPAGLKRLLSALGYDGLLYFDGGAVIGHVFFQRRGRNVHGFSTAVDERYAQFRELTAKAVAAG